MLKYLVPLLLCLPCIAQRSNSSVPVTGSQVTEFERMRANLEAANNSIATDMETRLREQQIANLVNERQVQLRRDTEKLVMLTAELKQHVDKAGKNMLSMEVIKTAKEIQKLAKSVQDKMKNPY